MHNPYLKIQDKQFFLSEVKEMSDFEPLNDLRILVLELRASLKIEINRLKTNYSVGEPSDKKLFSSLSSIYKLAGFFLSVITDKISTIKKPEKKIKEHHNIVLKEKFYHAAKELLSDSDFNKIKTLAELRAIQEINHE